MPERAADDLRRAILIGAQLLAEVRVDVAADHARGELDDRRGGAVVDRQVVSARARPAVVEAERVADLGAAEAVDRLILVGDAEDVAPLAGEQLQQPLLGDVRVLVLVDEDEAEGALVRVARLRVALEQRDRLALEAAEVERATLLRAR